jgi:hypothetical protein
MPACTNDQPDTCPSPSPSWSGEVSALIQMYCESCHAPGGAAFTKPLTSYSQVFGLRGPVLNQVNACVMPPADAPLQLPESARKDIVTWLVCGAMNN